MVRYGMAELLSTLLDVGTPRPAARWLLVAKQGSQAVPLLEGKPVPLGPSGWVELPADLSLLTESTTTAQYLRSPKVIDSSALLIDLKGQLRLLQADLKQRAEDPSNSWGVRLKQEYAEAFRRERTAWSWVDWRDNEVDQASVAWIVSTTFLRFCEDNDLLAGAKIDGLPTRRWLDHRSRGPGAAR